MDPVRMERLLPHPDQCRPRPAKVAVISHVIVVVADRDGRGVRILLSLRLRIRGTGKGMFRPFSGGSRYSALLPFLPSAVGSDGTPGVRFRLRAVGPAAARRGKPRPDQRRPGKHGPVPGKILHHQILNEEGSVPVRFEEERRAVPVPVRPGLSLAGFRQRPAPVRAEQRAPDADRQRLPLVRRHGRFHPAFRRILRRAAGIALLIHRKKLFPAVRDRDPSRGRLRVPDHQPARPVFIQIGSGLADKGIAGHIRTGQGVLIDAVRVHGIRQHAAFPELVRPQRIDRSAGEVTLIHGSKISPERDPSHRRIFLLYLRPNREVGVEIAPAVRRIRLRLRRLCQNAHPDAGRFRVKDKRDLRPGELLFSGCQRSGNRMRPVREPDGKLRRIHCDRAFRPAGLRLLPCLRERLRAAERLCFRRVFLRTENRDMRRPQRHFVPVNPKRKICVLTGRKVTADTAVVRPHVPRSGPPVRRAVHLQQHLTPRIRGASSLRGGTTVRTARAENSRRDQDGRHGPQPVPPCPSQPSSKHADAAPNRPVRTHPRQHHGRNAAAQRAQQIQQKHQDFQIHRPLLSSAVTAGRPSVCMFRFRPAARRSQIRPRPGRFRLRCHRRRIRFGRFRQDSL